MNGIHFDQNNIQSQGVVDSVGSGFYKIRKFLDKQKH
jgi:hypothetical protein